VSPPVLTLGVQSLFCGLILYKYIYGVSAPGSPGRGRGAGGSVAAVFLSRFIIKGGGSGGCGEPWRTAMGD